MREPLEVRMPGERQFQRWHPLSRIRNPCASLQLRLPERLESRSPGCSFCWGEAALAESNVDSDVTALTML